LRLTPAPANTSAAAEDGAGLSLPYTAKMRVAKLLTVQGTAKFLRVSCSGLLNSIAGEEPQSVQLPGANPAPPGRLLVDGEGLCALIRRCKNGNACQSAQVRAEESRIPYFGDASRELWRFSPPNRQITLGYRKLRRPDLCKITEMDFPR